MKASIRFLRPWMMVCALLLLVAAHVIAGGLTLSHLSWPVPALLGLLAVVAIKHVALAKGVTALFRRRRGENRERKTP